MTVVRVILVMDMIEMMVELMKIYVGMHMVALVFNLTMVKTDRYLGALCALHED